MVHALIQSAEIQENPEFEEPLLHWKVSLPEVPRMFLESLKIRFQACHPTQYRSKCNFPGSSDVGGNLPGFARRSRPPAPGTFWKSMEEC